MPFLYCLDVANIWALVEKWIKQNVNNQIMLPQLDIRFGNPNRKSISKEVIFNT